MARRKFTLSAVKLVNEKGHTSPSPARAERGSREEYFSHFRTFFRRSWKKE